MKILAIIIFIAIILTIIAFIVILKKPKPKPIKKSSNNTENKVITEFDDLMDIVKDKTSSSKLLLETLQKFNDNFQLDEKNAQKYMVFLSRLLTHKNVNKEIFQYFHKNVKTKNSHYRSDLEMIEKKALG